ncbi:GNAT family N-acetyltransferase [Salisediminibacterium selenitireducens]|uniref:GCN5-related N-acetyltransferase n=1 Tax=Bacillus selenitireducens (strain ATCC 700615 / DSM 15326 / MLS10) TaxID=439292 RepID=D6XZ15_BACIE|nr:GNAT family N-acetyltransferase [Salisediminibacterium selenitireducens]ADI00300.1 GCN5-related N-acetyltransferase [[Bacillus] selenitireducens MLS10]
MEWHCKAFQDLSAAELYRILDARVQVFVVEQNCPYPEIDGKDPESVHLYATENGEVVAYARLLPAGLSYTEPSIGRVLVKEELRKTGLGKTLMNRSMASMQELWEVDVIKIQAQDYARPFYASFGFEPISDVYPEDGIPHVDMLWHRQ